MHFPHAELGQSVLIQLPENRWIVVDTHHAAGTDNPTMKILEPWAKQDSFRLLALVVTHFHLDHYSGVTDLLELCQKSARDSNRPLNQVLQALVLPPTYAHFHKLLEAHLKGKETDPRRESLRELLRLLPALRDQEVSLPSLTPLRVAWTDPERPPGAAWVFTFHPSSEFVPDELLKAILQDRNIESADRQLQSRENRLAYMLGFGMGDRAGDFHVLLTSDIPGSLLGELARHLRQTVLPDCVRGTMGRPIEIGPFIHPETRFDGVGHRFRPTQCVTVPHHGSAHDPAQRDALEWWLDETCGRDDRAPSYAIVQGGGHTLGENTFEELAAVNLSVFATSYPERLVKRYKTCRDLDSRITARPRQPNSSGFAEIRRAADAVTVPSPSGQRCFSISGGLGGVHRVAARGVWEIRPAPPQLVYHELSQIFPPIESTQG